MDIGSGLVLSRGRSITRRAIRQEYVVLAATLCLGVVFTLSTSGFLDYGNLVNILNSVAAEGVLATGLALVIISGGIDLSVVPAMTLAGGTFLTAASHGWGTGASLAVAAGVAVGMGSLTGVLVAYVDLPALLASLGVGLLAAGLLQYAYLPTETIPVPSSAEWLVSFADARVASIPLPVFAFALVLAGGHVVLRWTIVGARLRGLGDNRSAAIITGLAVRPLTMFVFVAAAVLSLTAGLLDAGTAAGIQVQGIDSSLMFDALTIVVIGGVSLAGGRGGIGSVIVGALLIGVLSDGLTLLNVGTEQQDIVKGLLLVSALVIDRRLNPRDVETRKQGD